MLTVKGILIPPPLQIVSASKIEIVGAGFTMILAAIEFPVQKEGAGPVGVIV